MQCIFYASLGFFLFFFGYLLNETILLDHFFSYQEIALTTKLGLVTTISFLLTAIISALFLVLVVERAKKCLDFSATVHIFHLLGCIFYGGFPTLWLWWLLQGVSLLIMTVLGEYMCWQRELREIPLRRVPNILDL
jgi:hypothetical protein